MTPVFPAEQFNHAFAVTPSDTVDIKDDENNVNNASHVFLHNVSAGATVRVLPAGNSTTAVTIYIPQGGTSNLAVKRVFATTPTPPAGLIALYSTQR
jgi:hypothetical protein